MVFGADVVFYGCICLVATDGDLDAKTEDKFARLREIGFLGDEFVDVGDGDLGVGYLVRGGRIRWSVVILTRRSWHTLLWNLVFVI